MPGRAIPLLSAHNGVSAIHAAGAPGIDRHAAMAALGGFARIAACAGGCLCADTHAATDWLPEAAIPGVRLHSAGPGGIERAALRTRIRRAVDGGRMVAWVARDREGVIAAREGSRLLGAAVAWTGPACEAALSIDELMDATVCFPRGTRARRGTEREQQLRILLEWIADARRPPAPGVCASDPGPGWGAFGLAAFPAWRAALLAQAERGRPGVPAVTQARARLWDDAFRCAAAWLIDTAGRSRSPYHLRIRRAAACAASVVERCTGPLREAADAGRADPAAAAAMLERAGHDAAGMIEWLAEAAWLAGGRAAGMREALLAEPNGPLRGVDLHEVIYLARAGSRPVRQLAALRLAGSGSEQALATLRQLLYDADGPVRECALWAFARAAGSPFTTLEAAYRSVGPERTRTAVPLHIPLLAAALQTGDRRAQDLLTEAAERAGDEPADSAIRAWAGRVLVSRTG